MIKYDFSETEVTHSKDIFAKFIEHGTDAQNVYTPIALCKQLIDKLIFAKAKFNGKILVIANLEFVWILKKYFELNKIDLSKLYFSSPCQYKQSVAKAMGLKEQNVIGYLLYETNEMKFDIIIGNPPYQANKSNITISGSSPKVWPAFIEKALCLMEPNGFVSLITPSNWLNGARTSGKETILQKFQALNLIYLDTTQCDRHNNIFTSSVKTRAAWFVLQNTKYQGDTELKFNYGNRAGSIKIDFTQFECFPSYPNDINLSIFQKIYSLHSFEKIKTNFNKIKPTCTEGHFKYYQSGSTLVTRKRGLCINSFNVKSDIHDVPKVIIGRETGDFYQFFADCKGEFGVDTDAHIFKLSKGICEENVNSYFWSKIIRFYAMITPYGARVNDRAIKHIPLIDLSKKWNDIQLYKHFNLTQEEIDLIEATIK